MTPLESAITGVETQREAILTAIRSGLLDPQRGNDAVRGIDIALESMRKFVEHENPLNLHTIPLHGRLKQITYCADISTLEVITAEGTVRTHLGVNHSTWAQVNASNDPESGYYQYVWNKFPASEQFP